MTVPLGRYTTPELTGNEELPGGATVLDLWRWMGSDLVTNTSRGSFAEYLVALAVDAVDGLREPWAEYDIEMSSGIKIEVKSSAYLQSWPQKREYAPRFGIPQKQMDSAVADEYSGERKRWSDVYVFCLLHHRGDKSTLNPLDMDQWTFYVLPTSTLDEQVGEQKDIGLSGLMQLGAEEVSVEGIAEAVREAARPSRGQRVS